MTRQQLEHVIRAAADIADDDEIIVIGARPARGLTHAPVPGSPSIQHQSAFEVRLVHRASTG